MPLATLLVLAVFAELPVTGWLVGRYVANEWRSRVFSFEYVLSLGVGAVVVPLLAFSFNRGFGLDALYIAFAACVATILICAVVLLRSNLKQSGAASVASRTV